MSHVNSIRSSTNLKKNNQNHNTPVNISNGNFIDFTLNDFKNQHFTLFFKEINSLVDTYRQTALKLLKPPEVASQKITTHTQRQNNSYKHIEGKNPYISNPQFDEQSTQIKNESLQYIISQKSNEIKKCPTPQRGNELKIKLLHLNAKSLDSQEKMHYLSSIHADIALVQEVWSPKSEIINQTNPYGIFQTRKLERGGGSLTWIKNILINAINLSS